MSTKYHYPKHPGTWLTHVEATRGKENTALLSIALSFCTDKSVPVVEKGLGIADILLSLGLDADTLAAAVLYPLLQAKETHLDTISDAVGESCSKLLHDLLQMKSLSNMQHLEKRSHHQIENLRKMLLAMVTDVRAVLIILAERLWQLRQAKTLEISEQQSLANETMAVYAPLANRLGVWQLKWEIEDLCFRYLQPDTYKQLAKSIASRRAERETYITHFIADLKNRLAQDGLKDFEIAGRAKHIYSIYSKMQRKNAHIKNIYDMSALRVLVNTVDDCYHVLSILQNHWEQIQEEFDDYIHHPKANGYRSIHTVLIGPDDYFVEVQIRTFQMHQESELGVAAHWRYKEGVLQTSHYEAKIALLRQIIAWQKEVSHADEKATAKTTKDLFADRVYVFTPLGDIIDLPKGATPLDFAYYVHSEVGSRCRGAKVNGHIVPLTYTLNMGERVEILTAKEANPSRDWLNPHLGFLKTTRARNKLQHWFRVKDSLQAQREPILPPPVVTPITVAPVEQRKLEIAPLPGIQILGISNLLTHVARCCQPGPQDEVMGYITRNRGVSIHRHNCGNLMKMIKENKERLIAVSWKA